ncbi:MAG: nucleoid occlusion factor SlmA [Betaproteobacteria bacterium]
MSDSQAESPAAPIDTPVRKRPKPGERRVQILQALATMLEQPGSERITTAALASRLGVSEAALYRHFASKAQMFEALIDFIESSVFSLTNQLHEREPDALTRVIKTARILVQFAEKNPGMTRVMVGDALVFEHERLQERMNLFFDKLEAQWRLLLREAGAASQTPTVDAQLRASLLQAFLLGRLQRYARSGFRRPPSESLDASLAVILAQPA